MEYLAKVGYDYNDARFILGTGDFDYTRLSTALDRKKVGHVISQTKRLLYSGITPETEPFSTLYALSHSRLMHSSAAKVMAMPVTHRRLIFSPKNTADMSMDSTREPPCIRG